MSLLFRSDKRKLKTSIQNCKQQDKQNKISFIGKNGSVTHGRKLLFDVPLLHSWLDADNSNCL